MTVNPSLNGNTLTVAASGSGAGIPYLAFVYDLWAYIANPFDFSLIDAQPGNSHTFTHTYAPSGNESFTYCVEYGDQNDPGSCEANSYCATISFGTGLGIADKEQITEVQLYPVPANDYLNVYVNEPTADNPISYSIVDSEGKTVNSGFITNNTSTILLPESMQSGNYFSSFQVEIQAAHCNSINFNCCRRGTHPAPIGMYIMPIGTHPVPCHKTKRIGINIPILF